MTEKKSKDAIDTQEFALQAARLIQDRHCENLLLLDLHDISPITDYFLIATGTSNRQVAAVADELKRMGKTEAHKLYKMAGQDTGDWVVMDFVDLVIHLFTPELRNYYDLELIWGEAKHIDIPQREPLEP